MTKKYLKKNNLRDWLRVVASSKVSFCIYIKDCYSLYFFLQKILQMLLLKTIKSKEISLILHYMHFLFSVFIGIVYNLSIIFCLGRLWPEVLPDQQWWERQRGRERRISSASTLTFTWQTSFPWNKRLHLVILLTPLYWS